MKSCNVVTPMFTTHSAIWATIDMITIISQLSFCFLFPHQPSSSSMRILTSPFPIFPPHSKPTISRTKYHQCRVSIKPPPSNFDFKNEFFSASRDAIEEAQPGLLDLADNGTLFLIKKSQFGPVPPWRSDFVEPEAIWLIGTYHLSMESAVDVERVIRAVRPENVVVELCRSRQVAIPEQNLKLLIPALRFILIKTNFSPTLTLCLEGYHVWFHNVFILCVVSVVLYHFTKCNVWKNCRSITFRH